MAAELTQLALQHLGLTGCYGRAQALASPTPTLTNCSNNRVQVNWIKETILVNWNLSGKKLRLKGSNYRKQEILRLSSAAGAGEAAPPGEAAYSRVYTCAAGCPAALTPPPASLSITQVQGRARMWCVPTDASLKESPTIRRAQPAGPESSKERLSYKIKIRTLSTNWCFSSCGWSELLNSLQNLLLVLPTGYLAQYQRGLSLYSIIFRGCPVPWLKH